MAKTIGTTIAGFLGHYASEAILIASALKAALTALPVDRGDRKHITDAIERMEAVPEAIAKSIKEVAKLGATEVRVNKKDVAEAVAAELPSTLSAILPGMVEAAVAEAIERMTAPETNGSGA